MPGDDANVAYRPVRVLIPNVLSDALIELAIAMAGLVVDHAFQARMGTVRLVSREGEVGQDRRS